MSLNQMQHKTAVDWPMVRNFTIGGALAAIPVTVAAKVYNELKAERRRQMEAKEPTESDESTIVLTLPPRAGKKIAAVLAAIGEPVGKDFEKAPSTSGTKRVTRKDGKPGNYNGKPTELNKTAAGAWDYALAMLGTMGGGVLGYKLVDALYRNQMRSRLKGEEAAARTEMLDTMGAPAGTKLAAGDAIAKGLSVPILFALMGALGTGYLTKRVLDERYFTGAKTDYTPPKVRRIIFKSKPVEESEEEGKVASEYNFLKMATLVTMDLLRGDTPKILSKPGVQAVCKQAGVDAVSLCKICTGSESAEVLLKQAEPHMTVLLGHLRSDPQFRRDMFKGAEGGLPYSTVVGSLAGAVVLQKAIQDQKDKLETVRKQQAELEDVPTLKKHIKHVELASGDPGAQRFINKNRARIIKALENLAEEGKI